MTATWEAEAGESHVWGQPGQSSQILSRRKQGGGVGGGHKLSQCTALSSTPYSFFLTYQIPQIFILSHHFKVSCSKRVHPHSFCSGYSLVIWRRKQLPSVCKILGRLFTFLSFTSFMGTIAKLKWCLGTQITIAKWWQTLSSLFSPLHEWIYLIPAESYDVIVVLHKCQTEPSTESWDLSHFLHSCMVVEAAPESTYALTINRFL